MRLRTGAGAVASSVSPSILTKSFENLNPAHWLEHFFQFLTGPPSRERGSSLAHAPTNAHACMHKSLVARFLHARTCACMHVYRIHMYACLFAYAYAQCLLVCMYTYARKVCTSVQPACMCVRVSA